MPLHQNNQLTDFSTEKELIPLEMIIIFKEALYPIPLVRVKYSKEKNLQKRINISLHHIACLPAFYWGFFCSFNVCNTA